ncbi:phage holin family protein [Pseudomonas sp. v388]|uniref:phage holin family protein n=1 Tax=Pseudomonas sp. v388 TaxID=2479849 RepID=UPI000F7A2FB5|nr:phage holin family protein [Pseudomonas sp. v388]RRV07341.1 phage holin family protein [Pseudomonas sp. v388]
MTTTPNVPPDGTSENDTSVLGLLRQLAHEVPTLVTKEMALVKAELRESVQTAKQGAFAVGAGAIVMLGGLIMVLLAGVYALSHVLDPWLAALIVGVAALVIGFFMVQAGNKKLEPSNLTPDRAASSLQKDKDAIRRKIS